MKTIDTLKAFQNLSPVADRVKRFNTVMSQDRSDGLYPVICLPCKGSRFDELKPLKFLCPANMTIGGLQYSLKHKLSKMGVDKKYGVDAMFLMVGNLGVFPKITENVYDLYQEHHDSEDKFLYIVFCPESTFG
jgi:hypothetical protein